MKDYVILLLFIMVSLNVSSQIKGENIYVQVQPDHSDWNYKVGEKTRFNVSVLKSGTLLSNVKVDYDAGPIYFPEIHKKNITLKDGSMTFTGSMNTPGFYCLKVNAYVGKNIYSGLCTVGFSPEQLQPYTQCPDDFDEFWSSTLKEARKQELNPSFRLLQDRSTRDVNVYEVNFVNDAPGSKIYGILSIPVVQGTYPALLRVPGAGVRTYVGDTYTIPGHAIVLEIGIHGIPVTLDQSIYDELRLGALRNYTFSNLEDPSQNYYRRVIVGAVRSIDFLASLPQWDGHTMGVTGPSQGGFLSLAVAALDSRITFLAAVHNAMCDYEAELHGIGGGWPHYYLLDKHPSEKKIKALRYYDGANFARRANVPAWFSFGYNDETVAPTSMYSIYNIYNGPKQLSVYQATGHFWFREQWEEWQQFLTFHLTGDKDVKQPIYSEQVKLSYY